MSVKCVICGNGVSENTTQYVLMTKNGPVTVCKQCSKNKEAINVYIAKNGGIGTLEKVTDCSDCDCYDSERGGCTMSSCDRMYACDIHNTTNDTQSVHCSGYNSTDTSETAYPLCKGGKTDFDKAFYDCKNCSCFVDYAK